MCHAASHLGIAYAIPSALEGAIKRRVRTSDVLLPIILITKSFTLGIQSPCQRMIGVYNHLLRKVLIRFHYHSQKVIGSLGSYLFANPISVSKMKPGIIFDPLLFTSQQQSSARQRCRDEITGLWFPRCGPLAAPFRPGWEWICLRRSRNFPIFAPRLFPNLRWLRPTKW